MSSSVYIPSSSGGGSAPPASISIKTASYTIPSGRYAKVKPSSIKCTIDGIESFLYLYRSFTATTSFLSGFASVGYYLAGPDFNGKITTNTANVAKNVLFVQNYFSVNNTTHAVTSFAISRVTGTTAISFYKEKGICSGTGMQNTYLPFNSSNTLYASSIVTTESLYGYQEANTSLIWNIFLAGSLDMLEVPSGTVLSGADWTVIEYTV